MGLFDGVFGPKHPELDPGSSAAGRLAEQGEAFATFVSSANDRMEVVPGDGALFVFVGRPPKAFGLVWFDGGERHDVRSMMESGAMTRDSAARLVQELPAMYSRYESEPRFTHKVGSKNVVVMPSAALHSELQEAVNQARG